MSPGAKSKIILTPEDCKLPGAVIEHDSVPYVIGRSKTASLCIPVPDISRLHAIVDFVNGGWSIKNKSSNGLSLNDIELEKDECGSLENDMIVKFSSSVTVQFKVNIEESIPEETITEKSTDSSNCVDTFVPNSSKIVPAISASPKSENLPSLKQLIDEELQCSICNELFISVVTLNCSHSYCSYCINTWKLKTNTCPICRVVINSQVRSNTLDNVIARIVDSWSSELKEKRNQTILARKELEEKSNQKSSKNGKRQLRSNNNPSRRRNTGRRNNDDTEVIVLDSTIEEADQNPSTGEQANSAGGRSGRRRRRNASRLQVQVYDTNFYDAELSSDSESLFDSSVFTDEVETEDALSDSSESIPGVDGYFYGGYGTCFNCGHRGHWSPGCPFR